MLQLFLSSRLDLSIWIMGEKIIKKLNADILGVGASLICAIHCAIWPLLLILLPIAGSSLHDHEYLEYALLSFSFLVGIWSLGRGYLLKHKRPNSLLIFIVSFSVLVFAHLFMANAAGLIVIFLAACGIIVAHLLNLKWSKV